MRTIISARSSGGAGPRPQSIYRGRRYTGAWPSPAMATVCWSSSSTRSGSPSGRPVGAVDLLAGRLDGIVFRVTLDPAGNPLVYDSIHPCGCYHMFFPTARVRQKPPPEPGIEWAFVPLTLPVVDPSWRLVVRVASRTHYIFGLGFDAGERAVGYQFAEDDDLRSLPASGRRPSQRLRPGRDRARNRARRASALLADGDRRRGRHAAMGAAGNSLYRPPPFRRSRSDRAPICDRRVAIAGIGGGGRSVSHSP